jgi:hypothetical protein
MATRVVTVNDILDGHVGLDLECFDRIYLNGWVPNLQVPGQVVNFMPHLWGSDPVPGDPDLAHRRVHGAAARHARGFFEALCADNHDIGRPEQMQLMFGRRVRTAPRRGTGPAAALCGRGHPQRLLQPPPAWAEAASGRGPGRPSWRREWR